MSRSFKSANTSSYVNVCSAVACGRSAVAAARTSDSAEASARARASARAARARTSTLATPPAHAHAAARALASVRARSSACFSGSGDGGGACLDASGTDSAVSRTNENLDEVGGDDGEHRYTSSSLSLLSYSGCISLCVVGGDRNEEEV